MRISFCPVLSTPFVIHLKHCQRFERQNPFTQNNYNGLNCDHGDWKFVAMSDSY